MSHDDKREVYDITKAAWISAEVLTRVNFETDSVDALWTSAGETGEAVKVDGNNRGAVTTSNAPAIIQFQIVEIILIGYKRSGSGLDSWQMGSLFGKFESREKFRVKSITIKTPLSRKLLFDVFERFGLKREVVEFTKDTAFNNVNISLDFVDAWPLSERAPRNFIQEGVIRFDEKQEFDVRLFPNNFLLKIIKISFEGEDINPVFALEASTIV